MGCFGVNVGMIKGFEVKEVTEKEEHKILHLSILNDAGRTKYRICPDVREPRLDLIKDALEQGLETARVTDKNFMIEEYIERDYIFVNYPNGERHQYTAQRIKA